MIDPIELDAMYDELIKVGVIGGLASGAVSALSRRAATSGTGAALRSAGTAAGRYLRSSAGNIGAGMGVGGSAGGIIGAVHGGYKGLHTPVDGEEGGGGPNYVGALTGALSGGARGAAIGTVAGGAAGLASGGRGSAFVAKATKGAWNPLGMAASSGQRKLHSVTGLVPGGARRGTAEYTKALTDINVGGLGSTASALQEAFKSKDPAAISKARASYDLALRGANAGQTSLAGIASNIQQKGLRAGVGDVARYGVRNAWSSGGVLGKAKMLAMPVGAAALSGAMGSEDGTGERVLGSLGGSVADALVPGVGGTGGSYVSGAGSAVGSTVGKGIDRIVGAVRGKNPTALGSSAGTGTTPGSYGPPVERIYSNAALGKPPEGM